MPIYYGSAPFALKRGSQALNLYYGSTLISGGGGGGGSPTPSHVFDFSGGSLPAGVTFARAGTKTAVNASGVLATVTSGNAAFDYDSLLSCRGVSLETGAQHKFTYNNTFTNAIWTKSTNAAIATTVAVNDPMGGAAAWKLTENNTTTSSYSLQQNRSITTGTRNTVSIYAKAAERSQIALQVTDVKVIYDLTNGTCHHGIDSASDTLIDAWMEPVGSSGWWRCVLSVTIAGITGTYTPGVYLENSADTFNYTGVIGNGIYIFGADFTTTDNAISWAETTSAAVTTVSDSLTATDISWLNASLGTIVVEHDYRLTGTVIGSGANAIVSANQPSMYDGGKIAFAWDGTNSMTVVNGRAGSTGAVPTFSSDFIFGGTSAGLGGRRIKKVSYYASKLSEAQMQTLTARSVAPGTPNSWRVVSRRNRVSSAATSLTTTILNHFSRFQQTICGGDVSEIKLNFHNFYFDATPAENTPGNALVIDEVALESVTLGTVVPVYFSASRSVTLANGATDINSDSVLPSAFGLTKFSDQEKYFVRVKCHVTTAAHKLTGRRNTTEEGITGQQSYKFDPAATTVSSTDIAGDFTWTGTAPVAVTYAHTPFVIGKFVTGDPVTILGIGDSIMAGSTGVGSTLGPLQLALAASDGTAEKPGIEISVGGSHDLTFTAATAWKSYIKYCRAAYHETGVNARTSFYFRKDMVKLLKAQGVEHIIGKRLSPYTTSTDSWATEANQTMLSNMTNVSKYSLAAYRSGLWESYDDSPTMRGTDTEKWPVNGTASYYTPDGLHPSVNGHALLVGDMRSSINALTIYQPVTR